MLLAYIGAGLAIGPPALGLVHSEEAIAELSELGLAFLMFIVVLALQPNLNDPSVVPIGLSVLSGLGLVAGALLISRFVLPTLFELAAKSPEVVMISRSRGA